MHRHRVGLSLLMSLCYWVSFGCATIVTKKVADITAEPEGIRVYPPKLYLFVDAGVNESNLVTAPDFGNAYDVKPLTILSKHDFKLEVDDGVVKALTSSQDTTAFLTFFKEAAQMAAKGAGLGVSKNTFKGTFGLQTGIYVLDPSKPGQPFQRLQ